MVSIIELLVLGIVIGIIVFVVKRGGKGKGNSLGFGGSGTGQIKKFNQPQSDESSDQTIDASDSETPS